MQPTPDLAVEARPSATLFGHPRALAFLAATEFWERVSFHGMVALLVLYMVEHLLLPGHVEHILGFPALRAGIEALTGALSTQALASQVFGLYMGLVYLTPLLGGALGDRLIGRRRAVLLGAALMTAGHCCMAFDRSFIVALVLLIVGAGCLRGNLASQVGDLYAAGDRRRADAFQIYYAMLNSGAFVAPLVTGALGQAYGWHYGFGFAGVGMATGLAVYAVAGRHLPPEPVRAARRVAVPLTSRERRIVWALLATLPVLTLFWIAQSQIWNTYNLWARDHVDLAVGRWTLPVPWLQAVDALGAVVLVPPLVLWWRRQALRGREPDDLGKMGRGCLLFASAVLWLAAAGWVVDTTGRVPLLWAIAYHFLSAVGYLYFAPIAIALFARTAPVAVNARMIGVYYLSMFAGSTISGRLGGLYERWPPGAFWLLHAGLVGGGGVLILVLAPWLRRVLAPRVAAGA